jgi:hypothetical protein
MAIINKGKLLYAGAPNDALAAMRGKVWEKAIGKHELEQYATTHDLISNKLVAGTPIIHVMSDARPAEGFVNTEPSLEDVFFGAIHRDQKLVAHA